MEQLDLIVALVAIVVLAIGCEVIADKIGLPQILVLLAVGFAAGAPSWGLDPDAVLGDLLFPFVSLAVAVILFEGGMSLQVDELRGGVHRPVRRLLTGGVILTWLAGAAVIGPIVGVDSQIAVLMGAILVVTGPTVVTPMLEYIGLTGRAASTLRWEGILVDPIGAILGVLVLHAVANGEGFGNSEGVRTFLSSVLWGAFVGVVVAAALVALLKWGNLGKHLDVLTTLALVLGAFALGEVLREDSGYVSATVLGMIMANQKLVETEQIHDFKQIIGKMLIGVLFIILSARISPNGLVEALPAGLLLSAILIFAVRPFATFLATIRTTLTYRERAFVAGLAPRGIIAASVASIAAISLRDSTLEGVSEIVPVTFVVIVATVTFYGLVTPILARVLGLLDDDEKKTEPKTDAPDGVVDTP
jgi:NhaP-type Na+/H+ or K+/H+ antiporter